ncbi:chondroitin proteoglycan-2 [Drosophila montana]|uniref:chondroitin proteoglycan-2 n=1 Tax=Drosophila montana TaxID=40370 RepID=UPI00313BE2C5
MCQLKEHTKLICLLFLAVGLPSSHADVFPQCTNVDVDTFVMAIDDCASYIYCNGENSFRDSCPNQTYFDAKAQECAFDDAGVCLEVMDTSTAAAMPSEHNDELQTASTATSTGPAATEDTTAPAGSRPHCDASGDGYHPHAERCEYYYSCIGGYLTIVRCPYNYGWDYAQQQCKPLSEAQCFSL